MSKYVELKKQLPNDLTTLTWDELTHLHWEICEDIYQQTAVIREEIGRRILEQKKNEENLKKAS